jgi:hypothetical protein
LSFLRPALGIHFQGKQRRDAVTKVSRGEMLLERRTVPCRKKAIGGISERWKGIASMAMVL